MDLAQQGCGCIFEMVTNMPCSWLDRRGAAGSHLLPDGPPLPETRGGHQRLYRLQVQLPLGPPRRLCLCLCMELLLGKLSLETEFPRSLKLRP
ncbi:hypothetical protein AVEN_135809-1 [Araneus ventricosus]|uniref:Uncharacterized protein n=1 Tax=Araneus ventricosus TaxID=182803 RepID=A0A4Y2SXM3_ARAVE|nr:hypothetical protein AVEN_135809-1 [Araneus ventricosus]